MLCIMSSFTCLLYLLASAALLELVYGQPDDFDINSLKKNCPKFKCTGDFTPVPKSRTKFESTGCSAMGGGSVMVAGGASEKPYESCCHQWHACYQVCGVSKTTCDNTFEKCAGKTCDNLEGDENEKCKKDLQLQKMIMDLGGCGQINEAQYRSCECVQKDKVPEKREAAIRNFYKKNSPENVDKAKSLVAKADTPTKMAGLFIKLLEKYPMAIAIKEDPMKKVFDEVKLDRDTEGGATSGEDSADNDDNDSDEEKIEL